MKMISIDWIKPYAKNTKKHPENQINKIMESIKAFGFKQPILVNNFTDNVLVAGHGRLLAAQKLGLSEVPAISCEDLSETQIKAFRIADNRVAESEWDMDLLKDEFIDLKSLNFDLSLTGFDLSEVNSFVRNNEDDDDVNKLLSSESKYEVNIGDVYVLGNHRLMCGDSTNKEHVSKLMNGAVMNLMVTDPPYGVNYDPKWRDEADKKDVLGNRYPTRALGKVMNDNRIDWSAAYDLFNGDVAYVWHAGKYCSLVQESLINSGFEIINQIIWVKPHFALSRGDYHWKHEPCWYAVKKGRPHNWQGSRTECTVWVSECRDSFVHHQDCVMNPSHSFRQSPIQCMINPIKNNTKEEENVYDPFGGSGSTLIACERTNRKCYMMELDTHYASIIIERWEKITGNKAIKQPLLPME
jgi:DNA modification methylase